MSGKPESFLMERYGRLRDMDRFFDIAYWQRLGPEASFEAARQMVVDAHANQPGGRDESDFKELLKTLDDCEVRYLGGQPEERGQSLAGAGGIRLFLLRCHLKNLRGTDFSPCRSMA